MKLILGLMLTATLAQGAAGPPQAAQGAPSVARLTEEAEPGERLVVSGRVYHQDGRPAASVSLYVYQTDKDGIYSKPVNDSRTPRLKAFLRTDSEGRYEFHTIKPGSYPDTRNPAHIHYHVNALGYPEKIFEIVFEDDPLVDQRIRASAAREGSPFSIRPLTRDPQAGWRCTQDIKLAR